MSSLSDIMNRIQNAREEASSKAEDIQNEIENIKSLQEENNSIAMFLGGASGGLKAGPKLLGRGGKALRGLGEKTKGLGERLSEYSDMPNEVRNPLENNDIELSSRIRNVVEQNNPENTNENAEPNETDNPHESNLESESFEDRFKRLQQDRPDAGDKRLTTEPLEETEDLAEPLSTDIEEGGRTALQSISKVGGEALSKVGSIGETIGTGLETLGGLEAIPVVGELADVAGIGYGIYDIVKQITEGKKIKEKQEEAKKIQTQASNTPEGSLIASPQQSTNIQQFRQTAPLNF